MNTYEELLAGLSRSGVEYILVGGLAVSMNGYVRATEDVDILVETSGANLERMLGCLQAFGEGAAAELNLEDFPLEEGAVRGVEAFPLDIYIQMSGYTYEDLLPLTKVSEHMPVRFLDAAGLIRLKASSLRPKDQTDVLALRERLARGEMP